MPLQRWNKQSEKTVTGNKYWVYKVDEFKLDNGTQGEYHYVHTLGSTMIIPVTDKNTILLVKQFRYLIQKESIEFPCGSVEEGLSIEENALKELREETGYSSEILKPAGYFAPYNGVSDELCSVFIAKNLFHAPLPVDSSEECELIERTFDEIELMINTNEIWDGMTLAAWSLAKKFIL